MKCCSSDLDLVGGPTWDEACLGVAAGKWHMPRSLDFKREAESVTVGRGHDPFPDCCHPGLVTSPSCRQTYIPSEHRHGTPMTLAEEWSTVPLPPA